MKKILLDTDMGNDCDDAGAMAMLCNFHKQNICRIAGIVAGTSRRDSLQTVCAICDYYGLSDIPMGELKREHLFDNTWSYGYYARAVNAVYTNKYSFAPGENSVITMRKVLAESCDNSITFVEIGTQANIALLLDSPADGISPLSGKDLFNAKVAELVVMGGSFVDKLGDDGKKFAEFNIQNDVPSAQKVLNDVRVPITFCPFELGEGIMTGRNFHSKPNPVGLAYEVFPTQRLRDSWDPISLYYAVMGTDEIFVLSENGIVGIDDDGVSEFCARKDGNHRILLAAASKSLIEEKLEKYMLI